MKKQVIGITGPSGFIARHLIERLGREADVTIALCPRDAWDNPLALQFFAARCDAIVHLAGMNRGDDAEIERVNLHLAERLVEALARTDSTPHVLYASTTLRESPTAYGRSKRAAEERFRAWSESTGAPLSVLVTPNVYGAGCKPFYNSVVATFCHQLARGEEPRVIDNREVSLLWVGDLVDHVKKTIYDPPTGVQTIDVPGGAPLCVSDLLTMLRDFRECYFERQVVPDLSEPLRAKLYATFLGYVELEDHRHRPPVRADHRGELFEIIKLAAGGQVFFSTTKPGVIRGDHYHTRKVEWFCVLRGDAVIRLRRVGEGTVREFRVSGAQPEFISIPVMHTHHIENTGSEELLTMFWTSEIFDAQDPDTHYQKVA
ncbi:dTDP-L-rhamnose 4-epimerase [Pirellulimonas nuda]|uniref:dTDP-L-rhamnose 4-epimerase n=1 Tax=Pirellulimonas nuda TaxID=2528009 RepID=A0A518D7D5_9BACT|nr:NAD-dependent epimerase/dehydratase family protein [Pirellulimonas nuda]QDU87398.1 dTDP-L-rhamnose 4-epimerase [Pirellulimonas nuda]